MAKNIYTAEFESGIVTREYARPLAFAWRVEAYVTATPNLTATKFGFCATKEAAEKAVKLAKRFTVTKAEIVPATLTGEVASKAKAPAKAKKVKPCKVGDVITVRLGGAEISASVAKVGREYAYVKIDGALDPVKIAFTAIVAPSPEPLPLAQAA